jgi:hypothetical protein
MLRKLFFSFILLFTTTLLNAQGNGIKDGNSKPNYGLVYFEFVGIDDPSFPCWKTLRSYVSFEIYTNQVREWMIQFPSKYSASLDNHESMETFSSKDMRSLNDTQGKSIKTRINEWAILIQMQQKINQAFPVIRNLETELTGLDRPTVYMSLIHKNDLIEFFKSVNN